MKPAKIESSIGLDRLATWNEVRCALSFLSQGASELAGACDDSREVDPDIRGRACNLPEDIMWSVIVSKMAYSNSN
jgi:hypothetical protein